jgi:hypothetical protein
MIGTLLLSFSGDQGLSHDRAYRDEERTPPEGKAVVFVFRKDTFAARGSDLAIQLDGEIVGWPDGGEYVRALLAPGSHVLAATLVPKGKDSYSWYAEFWPLATATPPASESSLSSFDRVLLGLPPDLVLSNPSLAEDYKRAASAAIANAVVKKNYASGYSYEG